MRTGTGTRGCEQREIELRRLQWLSLPRVVVGPGPAPTTPLPLDTPGYLGVRPSTPNPLDVGTRGDWGRGRAYVREDLDRLADPLRFGAPEWFRLYLVEGSMAKLGLSVVSLVCDTHGTGWRVGRLVSTDGTLRGESPQCEVTRKGTGSRTSTARRGEVSTHQTKSLKLRAVDEAQEGTLVLKVWFTQLFTNFHCDGSRRGPIRSTSLPPYPTGPDKGRNRNSSRAFKTEVAWFRGVHRRVYTTQPRPLSLRTARTRVSGWPAQGRRPGCGGSTGPSDSLRCVGGRALLGRTSRPLNTHPGSLLPLPHRVRTGKRGRT